MSEPRVSIEAAGHANGVACEARPAGAAAQAARLERPALERPGMLRQIIRPRALRAMLMRPAYLEQSAWLEHVPFAFWLVEAQRPRTIVELGTHYGVSYFAFCQAVERLGLDTRCFAVDHWQGDEHAGFFGEEVFEQVRAHNDAQYSGFSRLVRSDFDDALAHFSDASIDLLHIDGLHTLEAVRHDFESWLPKLSERGVVLLHDSNVRERGFGVFRLVEELRGIHPCFEFTHGHGLAVLGVGHKPPGQLRALFEASRDGAAHRALGEIFARLGRAAADAQEARVLAARTRGIEADAGKWKAKAESLRTALGEAEAARGSRAREAQANAAELEKQSGDAARARGELDARVALLEEIRGELREAMARERERADRLAARLEERAGEMAALEAADRDRARLLEDARDEAARHERALADAREELAAAERARQAAEETAEGAKAETEAVRAGLAERAAEEALSEERESAEALRRAAAAERAAAETARARAEAAEAERARQAVRLRAADAELAEQRRAVNAAREAAETERAARAAADSALEEAQRAATEAAEQHRREHEAQAARLKTVEGERDEARARADELATRLDQRAGELAEVSRMLKETEGRAERLERDLGQAAEVRLAALRLVGRAVAALGRYRPEKPPRRGVLRRLAARLRAAGVLDDAWYLERNDDVAAAGIDPAEHYLLHGMTEGRAPCDPGRVSVDEPTAEAAR